MNAIITAAEIESVVRELRGEKVLLDADLATFYGVETRILNQVVRRNLSRFPDDFAFRLTQEESESLRSQIVISNATRGGRRYLPYAFTEQGVAMLSSVLKSDRAVQVNIEIMRAFIRLRKVIAISAELAKRIDEVEQRLGGHDEQFVDVIRAIRQLMEPPPTPKRRRIGFRVEGEEKHDSKGRPTANHAKKLKRRS